MTWNPLERDRMSVILKFSGLLVYKNSQKLVYLADEEKRNCFKRSLRVTKNFYRRAPNLGYLTAYT